MWVVIDFRDIEIMGKIYEFIGVLVVELRKKTNK